MPRVNRMEIGTSVRLLIGIVVIVSAVLATATSHAVPVLAANSDTYPWPSASCEFGTDGGSSCAKPNNTSDKYDWYVDENSDGQFTGNPCGGSNPSREWFDNFGYQYRNCTSYVAQKISQEFSGRTVAGLGNAKSWWDNATSSGAGHPYTSAMATRSQVTSRSGRTEHSAMWPTSPRLMPITSLRSTNTMPPRPERSPARTHR